MINELVIPHFDRFIQYLVTEVETIEVLSGLRKITLTTCDLDPDLNLSKLPRFITSYCINLEIIELVGTGGYLDGVPAISVFFQRLLEIDEDRWTSGTNIRITLKRHSAAMRSENSQQWSVTEMFVHIRRSLDGILSLIREFFPNLQRLELRFSPGDVYHVVC